MLRRTETGTNDFGKALAFSSVPSSTDVYDPGDGYTYWVFKSTGNSTLKGVGNIDVYTISGGSSGDRRGGGAGGAVHILSSYPWNSPSGSSVPISVGGVNGDSMFYSSSVSYADRGPFNGTPSPSRQYGGADGSYDPESSHTPSHNTHGGDHFSGGSGENTYVHGGGGAGGGGFNRPGGDGGNASPSQGGAGGNGIVMPWAIPQIGFPHPGGSYGAFAGGGFGAKWYESSPNAYNSHYGRGLTFSSHDGDGRANSGAGGNASRSSGHSSVVSNGGSGVVICRTPN